MAGSHHVMELPLTVYKCRASIVKLLLSITFVLRAVLCAVRIKTQKEITFLREFHPLFVKTDYKDSTEITNISAHQM